VCIGYRANGTQTGEIPATIAEFERLEPIYTRLSGWCTPTAGSTHYQELPKRARDYLKFIEEQLGVEIGMISTGPERDQTIQTGARLAELVGEN
jgi:adenylosuccinate synthase